MERKLTAAVKSHREHLVFIMRVRSPTFKNVLKQQFDLKKKKKNKDTRITFTAIISKRVSY